MNENETVNQGTENGAAGNNGQEAKTFTQEELNATISDRLKREREKYADYAELKKKAEAYDKYTEASKTELQKATDKVTELQKELDDIKQAEAVRAIREKVAKETGVPANLLSGSTEEDCRTQAEGIKAFANPSYPNVTDKGESGGAPKTSTAQQFADWASKSF